MLKQKNTEIIIGTNNKGKLREIKDLLPKYYLVYSPFDFGLKSPKENGKTFLENSLIKAKYFSKKTKKICISDDSGLEIDILDKKPGIYSARWAGKNNNFNTAISKIYRELSKNVKNWKHIKIKARFICALTVYGLKKKPVQSLGIIEGKISNKKKGKKGFGYDPIFIPSGKKITFGQMDLDTKLKIDHRAKAFKKIKKFF